MGEPATREAGLRALDSLWRVDDFTPVLRLLQDGPADVASTAFVLWNHADQTTWRTLFDCWREDRLARWRVWACELAGEFGGGEVVDALEGLARDRDGHVRGAAGRALMQIEKR